MKFYNAIVPHLQQLRGIDNRHFKALLHLYDVVDFNSKTIKYFDILNFFDGYINQEKSCCEIATPYWARRT